MRRPVKPGEWVRREAAKITASYCRRPPCPTITMLKGRSATGSGFAGAVFCFAAVAFAAFLAITHTLPGFALALSIEGMTRGQKGGKRRGTMDFAGLGREKWWAT